MENNLILQGWLTKSPPQKKTTGPFRFFKAKWRKRFFVLYEPLASESLPGTRAALDYYSNERYQKKLGTIDLDHCEEVLVKLDCTGHKHVFSLRTKHRGRDRTYYLSTATEAEMMKWVDCLCLALGLKENTQEAAPVPQTIIAPSPGTLRGNPVKRYVDDPCDGGDIPPHNGSHVGHVTQGSHGSHVGHVTQGSPRPLENHLPHQKSDQYIPLVDCYTGERQTGSSLGDKYDKHRASMDSIPPEAPPAPPLKTGRKFSDVVVDSPLDPSLYDNPTKSYMNLGMNLDDNENVYKIPRGDPEGVYKMPRGSSPDEDLYKMPRTDRYNDESDHNDDDVDLYKTPRKVRSEYGDEEGVYNIPRSDPVDTEGIYNVPRSDTIGRSHNKRGIHSFVPRGVESVDMSEDGIYNIPRSDPVHQEEDVYKFPRQRVHGSSRDSEQSARDVSVFSQVPVHRDDEFELPPPRPTRHSNSSSDSRRHSDNSSDSTPADLYDVPKNMTRGHTIANYSNSNKSASSDALGSGRKTVSENNILESVVPVPHKLKSPPHQPEGRYENLPPKGYDDLTFPRTSQRNSAVKPIRSNSSASHYYNTNKEVDDLYDHPPLPRVNDDMNRPVQSPRTPKPCPAIPTHMYVNSPYNQEQGSKHGVPSQHESFYMPMATASDLRNSLAHPGVRLQPPDTVGEVYTDMKNMKITSAHRTNNPSVHDVVPPPSKTKAFIDSHVGEDTYVYQTQRTRSFKRTLPLSTSGGGEVALPTRRVGVSGDVTSSDEESTSSGSHHDRSADSISYRPMYNSKPFNSKIASLNCTPPAPKRQGEVQYLDLALDEQSDAEKSPLVIRSQTIGNVSPTEYKKIDFIKTRALNETKRDVESKRKSSERSVDE